MRAVTKQAISALCKPAKLSHKGQNGRLLIVAGSAQYHGAAIFAGIAASRIVDLIYFATANENMPYVKRASPEFIVIPLSDAERFLAKSDAALIGPGLEKSTANRKLISFLLKIKGKKFVLDATALHLIKPRQLHSNCLVTPHAQEFKALFGFGASASSAKSAAKKFRCTILLKGSVDYITDGTEIYANKTGNSGMTKGGTGDVLAGLAAGFACKNSLLESAKAAAFLNGYAGNMLKKEKGLMYNASDLLGAIPRAMKKLGGS